MLLVSLWIVKTRLVYFLMICPRSSAFSTFYAFTCVIPSLSSSLPQLRPTLWKKQDLQKSFQTWRRLKMRCCSKQRSEKNACYRFSIILVCTIGENVFEKGIRFQTETYVITWTKKLLHQVIGKWQQRTANGNAARLRRIWRDLISQINEPTYNHNCKADTTLKQVDFARYQRDKNR